jgi:hypothetical protein
MTGTNSMRRQYRPALRLQSLKSVAQDRPADGGLVFLFARSAMRELNRRRPAEATLSRA